MTEESDLQRFMDAQESGFPIALSEVKNGKKRSHWMWYIFPQIQGLGFSNTSRHYALKTMNEAGEYIRHPLLGQRLIQISSELLALKSTNAGHIFGSPDDLKLRSCMTLFSMLPGADPVFDAVLGKFFHGVADEKTVQIIMGSFLSCDHPEG